MCSGLDLSCDLGEQSPGSAELLREPPLPFEPSPILTSQLTRNIRRRNLPRAVTIDTASSRTQSATEGEASAGPVAIGGDVAPPRISLGAAAVTVDRRARVRSHQVHRSFARRAVAASRQARRRQSQKSGW
jgi:hypothetical protein